MRWHSAFSTSPSWLIVSHAGADGLLRFVTSLSGASGHLAPPGYAGSLLGEYNLRFHLADILEQADALHSVPGSGSAPASPTLHGVSSSCSAFLGRENTEYLVGVLRGLPVSVEAVSATNQAEADAVAVAEAMASALEKGGDDKDTNAGEAGWPKGGRPGDPEVLEDMVKSVQAVFGGPGEEGGLGEGFIEACLSVLGWSPQVSLVTYLNF